MTRVEFAAAGRVVPYGRSALLVLMDPDASSSVTPERIRATRS